MAATLPSKPLQSTGKSSDNLRTVEIGQDSFNSIFQSMLPLPSQLFSVGKAVPMDLFLPRLRRDEDGETLEAVCFLPAGRPLSQSQSVALRQAGMDYYYTPRQQMDVVIGYMGDEVCHRLADPELPLSSKASLVYEQASLIVEQAMGSEHLGPNLAHGRTYIGTLHEFISGTPGAQQRLAELLVLDYGLFTHSVNVCLLTSCFAAHLRLPDKVILEMGLGALYHDLGKRTIPERILKKPGSLEPDEWALMRQHPLQGYTLLSDQADFPLASKTMVYQHHENLDGTGYPQRLSGDSLDLGSRLLRLVDAYDAITAVRVYKGAKHAYEAVRIIMDEMKAQVDLKLLREFIVFLGILAPQPGRLGRYGRANQQEMSFTALTGGDVRPFTPPRLDA